MRAINHALTGSLIGLVVGEPLIAVPLALASHFICDIIPHYASSLSREDEMRSLLFRRLLYVDILLCGALVLLLAYGQPLNWQLAALCAFVAALPDFASVGQFKSANASRPLRPNAYVRFANGIQKFEKPIGSIVEVAWFVGAIILLAPFLD